MSYDVVFWKRKVKSRLPAAKVFEALQVDPSEVCEKLDAGAISKWLRNRFATYEQFELSKGYGAFGTPRQSGIQLAIKPYFAHFNIRNGLSGCEGELREIFLKMRELGYSMFDPQLNIEYFKRSKVPFLAYVPDEEFSQSRKAFLEIDSSIPLKEAIKLAKKLKVENKWTALARRSASRSKDSKK